MIQPTNLEGRNLPHAAGIINAVCSRCALKSIDINFVIAVYMKHAK